MKHYGGVAGVMVVFSLIAPSSWGEQKCTHITIELNGAAVAAPQKITLLKTRGGTPIVVRVEDGCFQLPEKLWHSKSIDVIFQVDGDDIHLTGIRPSDFAVGWKLMLSDTAVGPFAAFKGVPAREICVLESDQGGDGTAKAQTGCRSARKKTDGSPVQK